jgi:hypothetical protein
MESPMRFFAVCLVTLALSACHSASVSESQCIAGDWQTVGYRDGAAGYRSSRLLEHQNACVKHGVIPDRDAYMVGWNEGVREYCEPNNGYDVGVRGAPYYNVCPADLRDAFLDAYHQGRSLYVARAEVADLQQEIAAREARLTEIKTQIVGAATQQLDPTLTPAARVDLLAATQRLAEEKGRIESELPQLRQQLAYKSQQLASLEG